MTSRTKRNERHIGLCFLFLSAAPFLQGQTVQITNDDDVVLSGTQVVNVGEHVGAKVLVTPEGTPYSDPQWIVTGTHIEGWRAKDGEPVGMSLGDYLGDDIHFMWKDVTPFTSPNTLRVSVLANGMILSAEVPFRVERQPKAEKFYSEDLLMENHNNWHSVYRFWAASTRRGDLFLAWHRSQLEYFEKWRAYFGYPPVPDWDPTTSWATSTPVPARRHPSTSPVPAAGFSTRHDLITLDLTDQGLATATEGEYDFVTQGEGRGTNSEFVAAGYAVRTETVRELIGAPATDPTLSRTGLATLPSWWQPNAGQTDNDPWFEAGCPARATTTATTPTSTCSVQSKKSFDDYTLRELGESNESGWYMPDFRVNYHALGHIAASEDMSNPVTSMRDPIFWAWHKHIDRILSDWQDTKGVEAGGLMLYQKPAFRDDWSTLRVAFSNRVIPEFVRPANVTVNGSPATAVTDESFTGTGYIFDFTGFPVPADGTVEVVVRREVDNTIRTSVSEPRPVPTLIVSTFGHPLAPAVSYHTYTKP